MFRPRTRLAGIALPALPILVLPLAAVPGAAVPSAHAGNLAETARGVDNKSSSDSKSSSSSDDQNSDDSSDSDFFSDSSYGGCLLCDGQPTSVQIQLPPPDFDLRLSAQKVIDSDGSFHADASMIIGRVGFLAAVDHYFESIESTGKMAERSEDIRVNLFELSAFARVFDNDVLSADLRLGFAAAASSHFDTLPGGVMGLRVSARANEHVALSAEARVMLYSHDISAMEAAAGAQFSHAWLGYRALKFDVGPVLEGPEAGLRFQF